MAIVEREVKAGDELCKLFGCGKPLVLKPCDGGFHLIAMPCSEVFYEDHYRARGYSSIMGGREIATVIETILHPNF
ncbi:hypothetical protein F4801DRAFT_532839 [Xylaria longipes]|nr:hypothetical protein F4801DRAFT_532839 [Xylaria longipes]